MASIEVKVTSENAEIVELEESSSASVKSFDEKDDSVLSVAEVSVDIEKTPTADVDAEFCVVCAVAGDVSREIFAVASLVATSPVVEKCEVVEGDADSVASFSSVRCVEALSGETDPSNAVVVV